MIKLFKEFRAVLSYIYSNDIISNQFVIYKNSNPFNKIKESFYYFIKGISVYSRGVLIINILAFLNLIFTIIIIIAFSNIEWEGFYLITLISSIFIKLAPVFIQE